MAYPDRLWRCNIVATMAGGEQIVHTVWMRADPTSLITPGATQAVANVVRDEWAKTINGFTGGPVALAARFASHLVYQRVTAYKVDAAGRATEQAEAAFAANGVKGTGTGSLPPQVALCVTLQTRRPGRSGRGRLYLGALAGTMLTTSGRLPTTDRTPFADGLGGFYTRLRDNPNAPDVVRPVVVSPTLTDSFKITGIAIGDVYDTMRSRRSELVEDKTTRVVDAN